MLLISSVHQGNIHATFFKNFIEADNKSVAAYISPSLKDIREVLDGR